MTSRRAPKPSWPSWPFWLPRLRCRPCFDLDRQTGGWGTFLVVVVAASLAQLFVVTTTRNQIYHTTAIFYVAGALLLPPEFLALLVLVSHIPDWLKTRYPWYIQTFNILNFTVAVDGHLGRRSFLLGPLPDRVTRGSPWLSPVRWRLWCSCSSTRSVSRSCCTSRAGTAHSRSSPSSR